MLCLFWHFCDCTVLRVLLLILRSSLSNFGAFLISQYSHSSKMDPNSAPSVVVNVISSSVGSPINRLPNEMMHLIVAKLEKRRVKEFIRLRLVSKRWQAVIEDYCLRKKSLIVCLRPAMDHRPYSTRGPYFEARFFGFANSIDFSRLILLYPQMSSQCLKSLKNLFANLERLSISCDSDYRLSEVVTYINSLNSLKQLEFEGPFALARPQTETVQEALLNLSPTLFKLVHFSFTSVRAYDQKVLFQLVSQLGPNCVRVNIGCNLTLHQWDNNISLPCLANLTHFRMYIVGKAVPQFVHFLCEHATSLKVLELFFRPEDVLALTPTVLRDLARLTQLVELFLWSIEIRNLSELEQAVTQPPSGLTSLPSVLTCKLKLVSLTRGDSPISAGRFARVISIILPNLVDLDLDILAKSSVDSQFKAEIEQQHLKRLPNLRKHEIVAHIYNS